MKINKLNPLQLFLIAVLLAATLEVCDTYISNRFRTNVARIISGVFFGILALPLFIQGAVLSLKLKYSSWAAVNMLCVIAIIGWTIWISLILYALKNLQFTLPPF